MFKNGIAGASGAFAIGLASSEFAKSLTMKAIIPAIQRLLAQLNMHQYLGDVTAFDFQDVTILAVYWLIMVFVSYIISEYIFGRLLLGTATVLDNEEKKTMKIAEVAVQREEGAVKVAHNAMASVIGAK
jgi:large-conductance mechanosensitive channel